MCVLPCALLPNRRGLLMGYVGTVVSVRGALALHSNRLLLLPPLAGCGDTLPHDEVQGSGPASTWRRGKAAGFHTSSRVS